MDPSALISGLLAVKADISQSLIEGNAKNYEQYSRFVGRAEGIQIAIQTINDLLAEKDDYDPDEVRS